MKVVCCICGKTIKQGKPRPVSHGICKKCLPGYVQEQERIIGEQVRRKNI
jgi:NMD protein affecting ribosome stability and mRNA decay